MRIKIYRQKSCSCSTSQFLENKQNVFSTFVQPKLSIKALPKRSTQSQFLYTLIRRRWRRWWWWRWWRWRGGSTGLASSYFRELYQWRRHQLLLFLLSASCAHWPLGWFELPRHLLCRWLLSYCWRLYWCSDRLRCHGNAWRCGHAGGSICSFPCFLLFREEVTQHFRLSGFPEQVPARFSRQSFGSCRFVTSSRNSHGSTGIRIGQIRVPVAVPCDWSTAQYWQINRTRAGTLRVWLPEKTHQVKTE